MGELKKRGQIWWVRYYRDGRRHEESSHSDKRENAVRILKVREGDVAPSSPSRRRSVVCVSMRRPTTC
jgi:hypothetical protein